MGISVKGWSAVAIFGAGWAACQPPPWSCPTPPADAGENYVPACESQRAKNDIAAAAACGVVDGAGLCQAVIDMAAVTGSTFVSGGTTYYVQAYDNGRCSSWGVWLGTDTSLGKCADCLCE